MRTTTGVGIGLAIGLVLVAAAPTMASAQENPHVDLRLGFSAGLDGIPSPLRTGCSSDVDLEPGGTAALRVALRFLGAIGVEGRGGVHSGAQDACVGPNFRAASEPASVWTLTEEYAAAETGPYGFLDARLRVDLGENGGSVLTLGSGVLAGGPQYVAGSVGRMWGVGKSLGLEIGITGFKVPWERSETPLNIDPDDPSTIVTGEPHIRSSSRWQFGFGVSGIFEWSAFTIGR